MDMKSTIKKQQPGTAKPRKKKRPWLKVVGRIFLGLMILGVLAVLVFYFIFIAPLLKDLPDPDNLTENNERYGVSSQIFDRHGVKLYEIYSGERRVPVKLDEIPLYMRQATVAIEDKNFYNHFGFDPRGILRAYLKNQESGDFSQGGSTITQQLVKKAFLTSEKSYERKIRELFLSLLVENSYSKDTILEMYLNYIPYGGTSVGIGAASESYFDKTPSELTLAEAALLAGLPQAPSRYSPFTSDNTAAKNRQTEVLIRMVEDGYITMEQATAAQAEQLNFALKKTDILAPHFVFYVRDYLIRTYGEDKVEKGGLRVQTTLDLEIQDAVQASVAAEVADLAGARVSNGAAMVTVPDTGEVLAMIGSRDYFDQEHDGKFNVTTAQRQPGSSIKPLVYATAFERKLLNPSSVLLDMRICFTSKYQAPYCPRNYSGGFSGAVTVRESLGSSLNIPAVKAMQMVGLENFINQANKMGIASLSDPKNYGPALALGGGEVRMTEMMEAFGTIANEGVHVPLISVLEVTDYTGVVLERNDPQERQLIVASLNESGGRDEGAAGIARVMDRSPAYMITDIMRDDRARWRAFGSNSELVIRGDRENGNKIVAVKTGTTNDLRDNWTFGFTPEFLVGVWVGNNDNSSMNQRVVSGVTGAAPIWNDVMSWLLREQAVVTWSEMPPEVVRGKVCSTGMPQMYEVKCSENREDIYWQASYPSRSESRTEQIWINKRTGIPPQPGEEGEELELQERTIVTDPFTESYCVDCARIPNENGDMPGEGINYDMEQGIKLLGD